MESKLFNIINNFSSKRILVLGDAMLDCYFYSAIKGLYRETLGVVVDSIKKSYSPGAAANTASSIAGLETKTYLLTVIGDDIPGNHLMSLLKSQNVVTDYLISDSKRNTMVKERLMSGNMLLYQMNSGSTGQLSKDIELKVITSLTRVFSQIDAVIISDYGYGVASPAVLQHLSRLNQKNKKPVAVDAKDYYKYQNMDITIIKPNYHEVVSFLNIEPEKIKENRVHQIVKHSHTLLSKLHTQIAAVTLDSLGTLILNDKTPFYYQTKNDSSKSINTIGAGDTFIGIMTLSYLAGANIIDSVSIASLATDTAMKKAGTAHCTYTDIYHRYLKEKKVIENHQELGECVGMYKQQKKKIVFTNGCFDILHTGHVTYLERAKKLGEVLILGINSDLSTKRLKGPDRPINHLEDRINVLSGLTAVDHIISFQEDTPLDLIKIIQPDVYAKGGDYTKDSLPEIPLVEYLGGQVEIIPYIKSHSTTNIIKKIKKLPVLSYN